MDTRYLFGLFVLGTNSSVIYRFLTDDLYEHLMQCFKKRGYKLAEDLASDNQEENEPRLSVDDAISQHFSVLIRVHEQTSVRHDPIRRIKLETGVQIFFDQIAENTLICMADKTYDTMVILKIINLLKALIKFHIGALPFMHYNAADQLVNRISAALQYYLNNLTTNQALIFESCEHLLINSLIRDKCRETCAMISNDVQSSIKVPQKIILITCNDKIVHMYISSDQSHPNNADLFLLLLNNTSRSLRKEFELQTNKSTVMAHRYQRNTNNQTIPISDSARTSFDSQQFSPEERTHSCPNFSDTAPKTSNENIERHHRSEVVFLRTSSRAIAPFTLFTIPLINYISILILVEWENNTACSSLYELIRHLDSCTTHGLFPYNTLSPQIKAVESSAAVRRYFEDAGNSASILTDTFNKAHMLHKSSAKTSGDTGQRQRNGVRILHHLSEMSRLSTDAFRHLFFDSDEYARRSGVDIERQDSEVQMDGVGSDETSRLRSNEYDTSPMTKKLRKRIISQLEDWFFSFVEVKSQRNITMNFCHNNFPGLVHFVFVDRSHGQIISPALVSDDEQSHTTSDNLINEPEYFLEKKILTFELECLSALQQGFTSYTMSDEHFTYNYTLRLQEKNGASMRLYKSFVQSIPPSVLHVDFYKALAEEYYPWLAYPTAVGCYELISVHLRIVPPNVVRVQCEHLWKKLMEPMDE